MELGNGGEVKDWAAHAAGARRQSSLATVGYFPVDVDRNTPSLGIKTSAQQMAF